MLNTDEPWKDLGCDHLLPRPPQNAPGAWGGSSEKITVLDSDLPLPLKQE